MVVNHYHCVLCRMYDHPGSAFCEELPENGVASSCHQPATANNCSVSHLFLFLDAGNSGILDTADGACMAAASWNDACFPVPFQHCGVERNFYFIHFTLHPEFLREYQMAAEKQQGLVLYGSEKT